MSDVVRSRTVADRNLLFGILALQMDFLSRDALIAGMQAWVFDKAKPLGHILHERDKITGEQRQALDLLVQQHLKAHGDDPQRSLAAVSVPIPLRAELQVLSDVDLQASLKSIVSSHGLELEQTVEYQPARGDSSGLRYQILRFHAEGGLGKVFVALDNELHREVALKEIKPEFADDPCNQSRFLFEAEVTGGLEHPGIVPVYGLGHYDDGRPYYAMRFIHGDSLKDAIARFHKADTPGRDAGERRLALRQLLRRFVDVCNALAYAHSRGVLHRDIKPANIMLGKYGETLLVDWGLAKHVGRSEVLPGYDEATLRPPSSGVIATELGSTLGTPAYMSPEQAAGQLDRLVPASDVYSLGGTLYTLLTGQAPFAGRDKGEILEKVRRGEVVPPRQVKAETPEALAAVCMKAMSLRQEDRYTTPLELAAEVEHWLADEPVGAWREPWGVRLGRWGRRHKTLVTGAAVLLVTAVVMLTVSTVLIAEEQKQTEAARLRITEEQKATEAARKQEVAQRERADTNFQKARDVVDDYLTQVSENTLRKSPQGDLQPLRKKLLEAALKYYQNFSAEHADDPKLREMLAAAFFRVGDITDEIGGKDDALKAFTKARDHYQTLAQANPEKISFQNELAKSYRRVADLQGDLDQTKEALASYQRAIDIGEKLRGIDRLNTDFQSELAKSHAQLGRRQHRMTDTEKALRSFTEAIVILEKLDPTSTHFRSALAECYNSISNLQKELGLLDDALNSSKEALKITIKLADAEPHNTEFQSKLAKSYFEYGLVQRYQDKTLEDALDSLGTAVTRWKKLATENPAVNQFQFELAWSSWTLGNSECDAGRLDEALRSGEQAHDILVSLVKENSNHEQFQEHLAYSHLLIGKVQRKRGHTDKALENFVWGAKHLEKLNEKPMIVHTNLACAWALCSSVVGSGKNKLTEKEKALQLDYANWAMDELQQAVYSGNGNVEDLIKEPDLEVLWPRSDFQSLIAYLLELKQKTRPK